MRKNMLKIAAFTLAALTVASCNQKKFTVEGTITDAEDSVLYLENIGLEQIAVIDSVKLSADGQFTFKGEPSNSPEFYRLRIHDQIINISIDSTETVSVKASYPTMITKYEVEGSENCAKIKELALKQIELQQRCFDVQRTLPGALGIDSLQHMIETFKTDVKRNYIFAAPDKSYSYFALFQTIGGLLIFNPQNNHDDIRAFSAVATSWNVNYPDALRTKNLYNIAINGMKNERIVQRNNQIAVDAAQVEQAGIIDIALPDNKGRIRHLSELKGKVVLLDFHVFALDDSPKRILAMRELYDKFNAQGLEIYQVSIDGDEHFWKQQTAALPWICVRDAQGVNSNILLTYNIPSVPDYFIIDRGNNLVKRMSQIDDLEAEIRKLL
ncbi:MAG: AhpC/TSA family protein [Prevotella sp.]|jgi:peroxiredoxin/predicted small secreted protein|nr:AhpC/TSA family protein [Prevotella sp.]